MTSLALARVAFAAAVAAASQQVYRSSSDVVLLDVTVLKRGRPVIDLTAADFLLTDNGVAHDVSIVANRDAEWSLVLLIDTSHAAGIPRRAENSGRRD